MKQDKICIMIVELDINLLWEYCEDLYDILFGLYFWCGCLYGFIIQDYFIIKSLKEFIVLLILMFLCKENNKYGGFKWYDFFFGFCW